MIPRPRVWISLPLCFLHALVAGCAQPPAARAPAVPASVPAPASASSSAGGDKPSRLLEALARDLPAACRASQAFLLGTRDPNGPSCVRFIRTGETDRGMPPVSRGDANGGVGLRMLQRCYWEHDANSPLADYRWHREVMVPYLGRLCDESNAVSRTLAPVYRSAVLLEAAFILQPEGSLPAGLVPVKVPPPTNWPLWCLHSLNEAVARGDPAACERWAAELDAAIFALTDLHRWVEFLAANQLANLRLVDLCKGLYEESQDAYGGDKEPYTVKYCVSRFPSGSLEASAFSNYMEVERQAERLFADPAAWARAAVRGGAAKGIPAAVAMPPDLREGFARWRAALGERNQRVLDRAAGATFERSFLANMLFRCRTAGTIEEAAMVLSRFDRRFPQAQMWQIMDMLPYRGGLGMAGIEWGDRFDGRLMTMSGKIEANSPREALFAARQLQYEVYEGSRNYKGMVLTLRRALDERKMDCIRATDLIATLYRGAGWPGFAYIRWCRGTGGHSIAVAEQTAGDKRELTIVDGLFPPGSAVGAWPDDYFTAHRDVTCAELFGRALDTCVFLEGYVVRGPAAGTLIQAPVPYLPGRQSASERKVFGDR